ncbi:MAG: hypothetical protein PVSMB8_12220 [Vulcanimicrobiaceae bacterium]
MKWFHVVRALWPMIFIVPAWLAFGRACLWAPAHLAEHAYMFVHEHLPTLIAIAALCSISIVVTKLVRANASLATLRALSTAMPDTLREALASEATALGMAEPSVMYLEIETPLCYTVVSGPAILISRGFFEDLDDSEVALVLRHELIHVRRRDPLRGLLWHLAFSALLIPGFGGLERWLYDRRERRTNALAGHALDARFARLARRVREAEYRLERSLGNAYAGALRPNESKRTVFVRPALATGLISALIASHLFFVNSLPMLDRHHC